VNATPRSIAAGRKIYMMRCVGCHGAQGNGDGPDAAQLGVRPARLSSAAVQEQADGVLWWKITVGRRPMPQYAFRLSSEDRWNVINYLRRLR
jgi:mono/diheme cytochrome c family protein